MRVRATGINPAMLIWARERAGFQSVDKAAAAVRRQPDELAAWESGAQHPTWSQLEGLAAKYHRPVALFFFPEPPDEPSATAEFRRLPADSLSDLEPDTWLAIREARERKIDLEELAQYDDTRKADIVRELSNQARPDSVDDLADDARRVLGVTLTVQYSWRNEDVALDAWRAAVQSSGVWVFKRHFKQDDIAGFCMTSRQHPLVYLNNSQSKTRQIFTLFHELAHLLFDFSHLGRSDPEHYVGQLSAQEKAVEVACNEFAGEFLVPTPAFRDNALPGTPTRNRIAQIASKFSVSREVVLRKYLRQGWIGQAFYADTVRAWKGSYSGQRKGEGGNYFATQGTYLGAKYASLAFGGYYRGDYGIDQLSDYLNVKASSIDGLESWLNRKTAAN